MGNPISQPQVDTIALVTIKAGVLRDTQGGAPGEARWWPRGPPAPGMSPVPTPVIPRQEGTESLRIEGHTCQKEIGDPAGKHSHS